MPDVEVYAVSQRPAQAGPVSSPVDDPRPALANLPEQALVLGHDGLLDRRAQPARGRIDPVGGPSTWKDQLDEPGSSPHHVAFQIQGMKEKIAFLEGKGIPLVQRGEYAGGRYA